MAKLITLITTIVRIGPAQDISRCQPTYDHLKYLEKPDMSVRAPGGALKLAAFLIGRNRFEKDNCSMMTVTAIEEKSLAIQMISQEECSVDFSNLLCTVIVTAIEKLSYQVFFCRYETPQAAHVTTCPASPVGHLQPMKVIADVRWVDPDSGSGFGDQQRSGTKTNLCATETCFFGIILQPFGFMLISTVSRPSKK